MDYGIALATTTESWRVAQRAEELGFSHVWFYDTQLLNPDVFIGMGLAAHHTKKIKLGTGVLIPSNRISPVTANAFATLNKMAPGRIIFGAGTGFTGRRTMGQPAIRLAPFEQYIEEVCGLLKGETVNAQLDDGEHAVRFLNPDFGLINVEDDVPLHISAFGPKGRAMVARMAAGWINFSGDNPSAIAALTDMQMSWANANRHADDLYSTLFAMGCVMRKGERINSKRVLAQAGPFCMVFFHNLAEISRRGELEHVLDPDLNELLEKYRDVYESYGPEETRYLSNHRGHLMFLRPEERQFLTSKVLRSLSYTAPAADLKERFAELEDRGYRQLTVQLVEGHEDAIEDWAEVFGLKKSRRRKSAAK